MAVVDLPVMIPDVSIAIDCDVRYIELMHISVESIRKERVSWPL